MSRLIPIGLGVGLLALQACTGTVIEEPSEQQEEVSSQKSQLGSGTAGLVISSDWGSGYCANVSITNGLNQATARWQLILDLKGSTITGSWNASLTGTSGKVTATPVSYNTSINPGAAVSFGFCANAPSASARAVIAAWNTQVNNYPVCSTDSGTQPAKAALAVAMAKELGRWDPVTDLTVSNGMVKLSWAGLARCSNGCANTKALLGQQDWAITAFVDQQLFNPTNFSQDLQASFGRQHNLLSDLARNSPSKLPPAHKLTLVGGPTNMGTGACGPHYIFQVDNLNGTALSSAQAANVGNSLCFFGYGNCGNNPYLGFTQTGVSCPAGRTCIAIDPDDGDTGSGTTTTAGSAPSYPLNRAYDPSNALLGWRCITNKGLLGSMLSKCAVTPNTCGYLYCIAN